MTAQNQTPLVSVIMPVYNAEKFLSESIDSILRQTFKNFEFIIINDGSSDDSQSIIDRYAKIDSRIIALKQDNHGVVYTANRAIDLAKGKYIARMDADDISMPTRLKEGVKILEKNQNTVLVCSSFEIFDEKGEFLYKDIVVPSNDVIKRAMYLRNPIANGSTLIRKESLIKAGKFDDIFAEDFHMWMKLERMGDFEATGTILYRWRMNSKGLTLSNNDLSMTKSEEFIKDLWRVRPPKTLNRKEIQALSASYKNSPMEKVYNGIALADISQLAAKLFIAGSYRKGLGLLFSLALSNPAGLRASLQRVHLVTRARYTKVVSRIPFGRSADSDKIIS